MRNHYNNIIETLDEMLTYFGKLYSEHDADISNYKSKLFEINVKIDELSRTQNVYALNTDYRKNIFSPIASVLPENEKELEIKEEIKKLTEQREQYEYSVNEETIYLKSFSKRIKKLKESKASVNSLINEIDKQKGIIAEKSKSLENATEQNRDLYKKTKEANERKDDLIGHYNNILDIFNYNDTFISTYLDKKVKSALQEEEIKLSNITGYIYSSPARSKKLIDEVTESNKKIISSIDNQLDRLNYDLDETKPLDFTLENYISRCKSSNPNINIDAYVEPCLIVPTFSKYVALLKLLDIFFDNIFKHSGAKNIKFESNYENDVIEVMIADDGKGLPAKYLEKAEWYSGIHYAKELIFLLNGNLEITSDKGTKVVFDFNIK